MIIRLIARLIENTYYRYIMKYELVFSYFVWTFYWNVKAEIDPSNYITKADLKILTGVDTSSWAAKSDLPSLRSEVDKIDMDKLKTAPADLVK